MRNTLLNLHILKTKPTIIFIIGIMGVGIGSGLLCCLKYAMFNPEISWIKKDSEKWDEQNPNYPYKFVGLTEDNSAKKRTRPDL
ncbi:NADH dehydrogenase [ubiquinone] 1 alpha subcomplex subunit 4-like 2 [Pogona vitticeps]|uniref:NADH dehydrogenase [ubiquinone] 1 alpha subcomplex subunit 4-like 2 n=1 Tax=Pogona vitticeps TaxID=103695 RepID=A0A6J0SHL3_9SAUR|nr:NADH dehydrogenase [ubiquinone] 1 alpha subcomplex subunit 4-like 2 [Pogona vitticeps]